MAHQLSFDRVDRGPQVSGRAARLIGGESQLRLHGERPEMLNWLGQWLLAAGIFTGYQHKTFHHDLARRPEPKNQAVWHVAVRPVEPWFDRVLEFVYPNGYRKLLLEEPRAEAFTTWRALQDNRRLHPLVQDLFRKPEPPPGPQSWRWVTVRGWADPVIADWAEVRSFWDTTDIGNGIAFYAFGWPFDETGLSESLLLQSMIASGDRVLLGIDQADHVRIIHWEIRADA